MNPVQEYLKLLLSSFLLQVAILILKGEEVKRTCCFPFSTACRKAAGRSDLGVMNFLLMQMFLDDGLFSYFKRFNIQKHGQSLRNNKLSNSKAG